jgi:riboflavin kinase / FMN adenylyltransferase
MQIFSQLSEVASRPPAVVTVGFFDGVHRGHQQRVRRTAELAERQDARPALVTCWPHPLAVSQPTQPLSLLTTLDEKVEALRALAAVEVAVVVPSTPELARLSPDECLAALLDRFDVRGLVVGPDLTLGYDRAGAVAWLRNAGAANGFVVEVVAVDAGGTRISSARIRECVAAGRVDEAADLLGRRYSLAGTVVQGDQRGRLLGFPTANLWVDPVKLLPGNGVYAVWVRLAGDEQARRAGVANIGVRPTFGPGRPPMVEVHLLDTQLDLYGQQLVTEFAARLREERRFDGVDALKAQIGADVERARALLAAGPAPEIGSARGERSRSA